MGESNQGQETAVTILGKDKQWIDQPNCHVMSKNSQKGGCALSIGSKDGVNAAGYTKSSAATFTLYSGLQGKDNLIMFECVTGNSSGLMLCDDKGYLSCRKRVSKYINVEDAEEDVVFVYERIRDDSHFVRFKLRSGKGYMGFDKDGKPLKFGSVAPDSDAALFLLYPSE